MSFPTTPINGQYHITGSNKLYKYNSTGNFWKEVINVKEEIISQVDYDIRNKALEGIKRNFGSNSKLETETGLGYDIKEENFNNEWILKDKVTTTLNFSNEVIPQAAGIPGAAIANADSVYVYVNNQIYAKCYKGVNDATYNFDASRVLLVNGNTLAFAIAIGADNAHWDAYGCRNVTDVVVRLEYYAEGYQEDDGITQYIEFEDGIEQRALYNQYNKEVEMPSGTYTPYKQGLKYKAITVMSGAAGDSADFFYKPEASGYNTNNSITPFVLKDGSTYKMWFAGEDGAGVSRLLYSTSTNGIDWSIPIPLTDLAGGTAGLVSYEGTNDIQGILSPFIIKDGNLYKMWYEAQDVSNVKRIMYSTSTDGIRWKLPIMVVDINVEGTFDVNGVSAPSVLKETDGTYKMWYSGLAGADWRIMYSTSVDGIRWEKPVMIIRIGNEFSIYSIAGLWSLNVIKEDGIYKGFITAADGTNARIIYSTSTDGINWSTSTTPGADKELLININEDGVYDTDGANEPCVIKEDNIYKMWYQVSDGTNNRLKYTEFHSGEKEILSINNQQKDLGYEIVKKGIPALSGLASDTGKYFDKLEATNYNLNKSRTPWIIKDGSTYKMWFTGGDGTDVSRLLYSTSTNGTNWTTPVLTLNRNLELNNYDDDGVEAPCVIKDGDTYKMWYSGLSSGNFRILYTSSVDGTNWSTPQAVNSVDGTKPGLVNYDGTYDTTSSYGPCVIKDGDIYKMWYSVLAGADWRIMYSTSVDGVIWNQPRIVRTISEEGSLDIGNVWGARVIKDGNLYKMFYHGYNNTFPSDKSLSILYTTSVNGINWERTRVLSSTSNNNEYEEDGILDPYVIKDGDTYKMWYSLEQGTSAYLIFYSEFKEKDLSLYLDRDNNKINLYKTGTNVIQLGITKNLFLDQSFESQTNGIAIGGDWDDVNNFQGSNTQANSGLLSAYSTSGFAGDYIKQTVSGLDTNKVYTLSCIAREGSGAAFNAADLGPVFEDTVLDFDEIKQIGVTNWYYCKYRAKPSAVSGLFGFQVKDNLNFYIDNVHFGLDEFELALDPESNTKELISSVDITGDTEYKCLLEVKTNGTNYDVTAIINDIEVSGSLAKDEYTFLQKFSFIGENLKGSKGSFIIRDLKAKWGTDKTLYQLFKFEEVDKDLRKFSDGGMIYGIVESGSNEKGSWIKYEDGTMICWGEYIYNGPRDSSWGTGFYKTPGIVIKYPKTFISIPSQSVTPNFNFWMNTLEYKNGFSGYALYPSSSANVEIYVFYQAIGKWK